VVGPENVIEGTPRMGAEDFSYFLEQKPGSYFFVGHRNEERGITWGHHHPRFDVDEESLGVGLATMAESVLTYLTRD
ncbi:MAG TPA: M20/M25/M40 family metallo-hydrolase, partial [Thermomicrobiales bacterium]|nr:M20/M25/M40 family metallo-hydrolase [Thermomicrobiales bacterium]